MGIEPMEWKNRQRDTSIKRRDNDNAMVGRARTTICDVFPSAHVDLASDPGRFSVTMDAADLEYMMSRMRHPSAR